ncbi:hypothetical protein [Algibacter lectus]|uniref:hypothetical protein n=1 Tax=Algibacter lectus TaxID=221126 RepID=UPI0005AB0F62|nr:hypothetical protein [Algibacter lectus]SFB92466.1 hypothetical protein SAMN04489722_101276 [Algibacter lectus]
MKNIISTILLIYFTSISFAQKVISKPVFDNIQYVESVEWHNDDIYCAGYSFKTKLNDGNSTDAYLINYDKNLNPKWALKIDEKHSNIIYSIKTSQDK